MDKPQLISIIIPVFNDLEGIARTLEGVSRQSWPQNYIEVIVVDNGSDQPVALESEYAFSVQVIRCETPGSYAARNAGIAAAKGDVFAFTDADCVADPDWLEFGLERVTSKGTAFIVGGEVLFTEPVPRNGISLYQSAVGFQQAQNIHGHRFSATANLFCAAETFRLIGPFDERLLSGGDREWSWRAQSKGIDLVFEPRSVVRTAPRTSWASAIRQARRVAAGRLHLLKHGLAHAGDRALRPHRTTRQSLIWLIQQEQFGTREKFSVLTAAIVLKGIGLIETLRVQLGSQPERR